MKCKLILLVSAIIFLSVPVFSQTAIVTYKWWNPAENTFPVLEGQAWPKELNSFYDRLPARAEQTVRPDVWNLSKNSAGLYIKFNSNASDIIVKYVVQNKGSYAMPHMPATGVSGIDLYAITQGGQWVWAPGRYKFGDTIEYHFSNMEVDQEFKGRDCEFRLFLPLYNSVTWMQFGVPADKSFIPAPLTKEKPIVIYGTSIAQGGCASRPGLAWTAILERKLDRPLINLAFSGNGRLEKPVIDLINEIDASIYVLDCLPNLVASGGFSDEELERRISTSIKDLREKHPSTPILIVEHSLSRSTGIIETVRNTECEKANKISQLVFAKLTAQGVKGLYQLTNAEIGLGIDATVDGVHPNDIGMEKYAAAYTTRIQTILREPQGTYSTTIPVIQTRDGYDWRGRHEAIKLRNKNHTPENVIIGNSIIHYWAGEPAAATVNGADSWKKYLEPLGLQNMGFGWDRVENALWRIYHGELDDYTTKHVVVMIGTNNLGLNTDKEIIAGLKQLLEAIKLRQPRATILLSGIFPRRDMEKRVATINAAYAKLALAMKVVYINPGKVLLNSSGKIDESLFGDGLHPNAKGYDKLAPVIAGYLK
ncbi:MAG: lipolytic protein family [Chitinophagaceae bacterium]|nr:lipolytic protein family [Chitinophagaceae bacterium]